MLTLIFWKKAWAWLKNYWYLPVILILAFALLFAGKGKNNKLFDLIEKQRENYKKEIDVINKANAEKDKKKLEAIKTNKERLQDIERQFDIKIDQLEKHKEKELEQTIKKFEDNPDELAKKIAEILEADLVER